MLVITGAEQESYVPVRVNDKFGWVAREWIERDSVVRRFQCSLPARLLAINAGQGNVRTSGFLINLRGGIENAFGFDVTGRAE